jgi:hypothetical protein
MSYLENDLPALLNPFKEEVSPRKQAYQWCSSDQDSLLKILRNLITNDSAAKKLLFVVNPDIISPCNRLVPKLEIPGAPFVYQLDCFIVHSKIPNEGQYYQLFYRSKADDGDEFHGFSIENNQDIRFTDKFVWSSNNEVFTPPDSHKETLVYALVYKRKLVKETRPSNSIHLVWPLSGSGNVFLGVFIKKVNFDCTHCPIFCVFFFTTTLAKSNFYVFFSVIFYFSCSSRVASRASKIQSSKLLRQFSGVVD